MNLRISGCLDHDGDGVVRYEVKVSGRGFAATTLCWGDADLMLELGERLADFPFGHAGPFHFSIGAERSGTCELEFVRLDAQGHCGVWVSITGESPVHKSQGYERASIFLNVEPAGIDNFVKSLRSYHSRSSKEAFLYEAEA